MVSMVLSVHVMCSMLHRGLDDAFVECLAAAGFVVFNPNYRGSDNLGGAFQRGVIGDAGDGPSKDVMAGVEVCVSLCVCGQVRHALHLAACPIFMHKL
eukprot:COSAG02_NODE_55_length_43887_cov_30.660364_29_plen_98_part_00